MRRIALLVVISAAAALLAGQAIAAAGDDAAPDNPPGQVATIGAERVTETPAAPDTVDRPTPTSVGLAEGTQDDPSATTNPDQGTATTAAPDSATDRKGPERPERFENLRLHCAGVRTDAGLGVACRWSKSNHPRAVGYQLVRGDGEQRQVLFATRDLDVLRHLDTKVVPGERYLYAVLVLDGHGQVVGRGGPVVAGLPDRPFDQVRFGCERASDGEHRGIACGWSETARDDARGYVLYRSIDGGAREVIARVGLDGRNHHFDSPLRPGHRYTYAVVVVNAAGRPIGGGGPVTIGIPAPEPGEVDPPSG